MHQRREPGRTAQADRFRRHHLSLQLTQHDVRLRAVAFGGGDWADDLAAAGQIDVAFRPVINDFRGRQSVELHLVDWQGS